MAPFARTASVSLAWVPARLRFTVARDLAPLGYEVTVFDGEARSGSFIRAARFRKFRLPESVIDEETGYIPGSGREFQGGQRIDSMKSLLDQKFDAVFVGLWRTALGSICKFSREEAKANIHRNRLALQRVLPAISTKIGKARHRIGWRQYGHGLPLIAPSRRR